MINEVLAQDILILDQSINTNIKGFIIESLIMLIDSIDQNYSVQGLLSVLHLTNLPELTKTTHLSVSNNLVFNQQVHDRVYLLIVENRLYFVDSCESKYGDTQSIDFSQESEVNKNKGSYSLLTFNDLVEFNVTRNLTINQTFEVNSNITGYLPSKYWTSFNIPPF